MRIKAITAALILLLFFLLGIGATILTGYWRTESSKEPARFTTGEAAGEYNPADIRGSYSLGDIETAFKIPLETLAKAFGVSDRSDPAAIQLKEFEEAYGEIDGKEVGTDSMRLFVSRYLGLPYGVEETTALPQPAFNILKKEASLSSEELSELEGLVLPLESFTASTESDHEETVDTTVKGKTTFADLLDWGLSQEQIESALGGMEMGKRGETVRDYCLKNNIEFSDPKTILQEMVDNL